MFGGHTRLMGWTLTTAMWRNCNPITGQARVHRHGGASRPQRQLYDPDVLANGYVTEIDYPKYGKRLKVHGSPWHFSETPTNIGIAPELGAHNKEILPAQIEDLRQRKII